MSNPYAKYVAGQDAGLLVRQFPPRLESLISQIGDAGMVRSLKPGKWTVSEILCHLADTEIAFSFRWRQTLAEENHTVQPFNQDLWAPRYPSIDGRQALRTFLALRAWNAILLEKLLPGDWDRAAIHPELGQLSFKTLVEIMAGHDLHHLAQLQAIADAAPSNQAVSAS